MSSDRNESPQYEWNGKRYVRITPRRCNVGSAMYLGPVEPTRKNGREPQEGDQWYPSDKVRTKLRGWRRWIPRG